MMRSSSSSMQGKVEAVTSEPPLENGLPPKERLPTIQIDTVASAPPSPDEWTPPDESNDLPEEPLDESDIQLDLQTDEPVPDPSSEDLKESLKSYVEDLLSQAMVLAEKKLQFAGLPEDDEEEDEEQPPASEPTEVQQCPAPSPSEPEEEEPALDESEVRAAAEKVVQEVIAKASETAEEKLDRSEVPGMSFPGLPSIQIDTVPSPPPSPDDQQEAARPQKKWSFTMDEEEESERGTSSEKADPIKFDDAPEDVKEMATSLVKEIVGKAIAKAEEKTAPTVPFNFEDVDLMKTSGPWYIRAREALIRLLRTACFCTPRRTDS